MTLYDDKMYLALPSFVARPILADSHSIAPQEAAKFLYLHKMTISMSKYCTIAIYFVLTQNTFDYEAEMVT